MIKVLMLILSLNLAVFAQSGPSKSLSAEEAVSNEKGVKKVWKNVLKGYQQARNAAKVVVQEMKLTASMAHAMENMLISWERTAKKTQILFSKQRWEDIGSKNPITLLENVEEKFFQESDELLYYHIPNAISSSKQYSSARKAWIRGVDGLHEPAIKMAKEKVEYLSRLTGLSDGQKQNPTKEKIAHETRTKSLAMTSARSDVNLLNTDNDMAQLDYFQEELASSNNNGGQGLKSLYQIGNQQSENSYYIANSATVEKVNSLEILTNIQTTKSSAYSRQNTYSYLVLSGLVQLSDELKRIEREGK